MRQPHSFLPLLESSCSVLIYIQNRNGKKMKIGGFTLGQSWENEINTEKHTQGNRKTFLEGRQPHFFLTFLDSSCSVLIYIQNRNGKKWKLVVLHLVKVEKMRLIQTNTHKAREKLFWRGDNPTFNGHFSIVQWLERFDCGPKCSRLFVILNYS